MLPELPTLHSFAGSWFPAVRLFELDFVPWAQLTGPQVSTYPQRTSRSLLGESQGGVGRRKGARQTVEAGGK